MNINELIINLESREGKKKSYDFSRMRALLEELDNPHIGLKYLHVAGTNGKGSTSNFLYNILKMGGYKVGLYTSPHLERYNERIKINGVEISDEDFIQLSEKVFCAEENIKTNFETLTFFEFITAIAFLYFNKEKSDYVILEVGMGGLSDSTNVILEEDKLASIITPISMDHTQFLGKNIEEIAYQKAGIIKKNVPVFSSNKEKIVKDIIEKVSKENNSEVFTLEDVEISSININDSFTEYNMRFYDDNLEKIKVNLIGYYQMYNSALSIMTILKLRDMGKMDISNENIKKGIENTFWAGRMEIVREKPKMLLDGAHNLDGIRNLTKNISLFKYNKLYIIAAILEDKEHKEMLKELSKYADEIVLVGIHTKRKTDPLILESEIIKSNVVVSIIEDLEDAIKNVIQKTSDNDFIIVTGSLYLISEIKEILKNI